MAEGKDLPRDEDLIEAARGGDERSFEILFHRYSNYVLLLGARFGVTGEAAFDLLQETYLVFFRKLPAFRLKAKFSTFLYPTVRFLSLKKTGRKDRWYSLDDHSGALPQVPARENLDGGRREMVELVSSLPEAQREVLLLRYLDDMSLKEIAAAADIPLGTVKSRLHNALAALRRSGR